MTQSPENDNRWYPQYPMVGVGALVMKEGRVLLVKRGKEPGKGMWSIPGGRLELGETVSGAVKREVLEECGVEIDITRILDVNDAILHDDNGKVRYHFVLIDFLADYVSGEPEAQSDVEECRWVTREELTKLDMNPRLRSVIIREIRQ